MGEGTSCEKKIDMSIASTWIINLVRAWLALLKRCWAQSSLSSRGKSYQILQLYFQGRHNACKCRGAAWNMTWRISLGKTRTRSSPVSLATLLPIRFPSRRHRGPDEKRQERRRRDLPVLAEQKLPALRRLPHGFQQDLRGQRGACCA